jgi:outer membrane protein OmpA-like peptidoglycan-associated protein
MDGGRAMRILIGFFALVFLAGCASQKADPIKPCPFVSTITGQHFCYPNAEFNRPEKEQRADAPSAVLDSESQHLDGILPFEEKITYQKNSAAVNKKMMKRLNGIASMMLLEPKYNLNVIGVSSTRENPGVAKRRADVATMVLVEAGVNKERIRSTYFRVKPDLLNSPSSLRKTIFTNAR